MKFYGLLLMLIGSYWAYIWRHDSPDLFTPLSCLVIAAGFYLFFEAMKRDIIEAMRGLDHHGPRHATEITASSSPRDRQ